MIICVEDWKGVTLEILSKLEFFADSALILVKLLSEKIHTFTLSNTQVMKHSVQHIKYLYR